LSVLEDTDSELIAIHSIVLTGCVSDGNSEVGPPYSRCCSGIRTRSRIDPDSSSFDFRFIRGVEQAAEELCGVLIGFCEEVGVDVESGRAVSVAKAAGDGTHIDTRAEQPSGDVVAQVVEPNIL
jgi:hypothetical protein